MATKKPTLSPEQKRKRAELTSIFKETITKWNEAGLPKDQLRKTLFELGDLYGNFSF